MVTGQQIFLFFLFTTVFPDCVAQTTNKFLLLHIKLKYKTGETTMTRIFCYYGALDIGSAFPAKQDVGTFIEYMIRRLHDMVSEKISDDFIPPVVYSAKGKVFNFDYNFIINCLDDFHDNVGIKDDFYLTGNPSQIMLKNAAYLIGNIFDEYYDIVRVKQRTFDASKIRANRPVEIKDKFYNPLLIQNGKNIKRFSAVPFSASELKKMLSASVYNLLESLTSKDEFRQIAFGVKECMEFVRNNEIEPDFVTD
jgi:hypothetical protein